jgi:hypothetical protein
VPRRRTLHAALLSAAAVVLGGGALAPGAPLANDAGSVTHSAGQVTATLQWDKTDDDGIGNPRLFVVRAGVRYDLTIADICLEGCIVVPDDDIRDGSASAVKVADLDGDGEPEVLVDVFSGGAHCCLTMRLLTWNGTGYTSTDADWRDLGYQLKDADGDGRPELVGNDPNFSAAFTAFAASAFPPLIFRLERGRLVDVTRAFPKLVRSDATTQRKLLRKLRRTDDVRGVLAAYVADEYLLGQSPAGLHELDRQRARGAITKAFRPYLLKKLRAWGYR